MEYNNVLSDTISQSWADRRLTEKLQLLVISSSFERATLSSTKRPKAWRRDKSQENGRLVVEKWARDWIHLVPDYRPIFHNVPFEKLPVEAQRSVDDVGEKCSF
jgi:hypothetical protein